MKVIQHRSIILLNIIEQFLSVWRDKTRPDRLLTPETECPLKMC